jgi:hypothetical protein
MWLRLSGESGLGTIETAFDCSNRTIADGSSFPIAEPEQRNHNQYIAVMRW